MTPEAQRIAIAEACGWQHDPLGRWWKFEWNPRRATVDIQQVPNYLSDLNAMHEAEKTLKGDQICQYANWLWAQVPCDGEWGDMIWHATAAQRAEAFLRTIGKWEEST